MTVLASVLPGLRELRAPLAAGYLWLITAWVAAEPSLPSRAEATGLVAAILRLEDAISPLGAAAVLSFVAYLIGSISETAFAGLRGTSPLQIAASVVAAPRRWARQFGRLVATSSYGIPAAGRAPNLGNLLVPDPPREQFTERGERALREVVNSQFAELEAVLTDRGVSIVDHLITPEGSVEVSAIDDLFNSIRWRDEREQTPEGLLREDAEVLAPEQRVQREIAWRVLRDFGLMRTRLLGTEQELFSAIDRLRAEAELRAAVVPPLFALVIVGVLRGGWWALLALPGLLILWRQRTHRLGEAGDTLLDLLALGRVQSPALERLEAGIDQLRTRSTARSAAEEQARPPTARSKG